MQVSSAKPNLTTGKTIIDRALLFWICPLFILYLTYISLSPTLENGFTNWDDDIYVTENRLVQSENVEVKQFFKTPVSCNYHPVTMLSLAWNYQMGQLEPSGYHAINLFLHLLNTVLVFWFAFLLSDRSLLISSVTSLLFGIHPMHVESVAWISERKDVLYLFFFLSGLIFYLKHRKSGKNYWLILCFISYCLSCLSKGMAVVFPVILFLIDYFLRRPWNRKMLLEKAPFMMLSVFFGFIAVKNQIGVAMSISGVFSLGQRAVFASYGALQYIAKFFFPINLSSYYPYPAGDTGTVIPPAYYLYPCLLVTGVLTILFFKTKQRILIFGLLFFLTSLLLVLQLVSVGTAIMADRYTYLAYIGPSFIIGHYIKRGWQNPLYKYPLGIGFCIMIAFFCYQTHARCKVWHDSELLWTDVIEKSPASKMLDLAYLNRGKYYGSIGNKDKALRDYNKALALNPAYAIAYNNRGNIYRERGLIDSAFLDFNKAIAIDSNSYLFYANRALVYRDCKRGDLAEKDFAKSIALNSSYWANYYNRGLYYLDSMQDDKAVADFTMGLKLQPDFPDLYYRRGVSNFRTGRYRGALADFDRAIILQPGDPTYWFNRSRLNTAMGRMEEAAYDAGVGNQLLSVK